MTPIKIKFGTGNRITIPKELCNQLKFNVGDNLFAIVQDNNLIITSDLPSDLNKESDDKSDNLLNSKTESSNISIRPVNTENKNTSSRIVIKSNLQDKGKFKHEKYSDCNLVIRTKQKYIEAFCSVCKGQLVKDDSSRHCRYKVNKQSTLESDYVSSEYNKQQSINTNTELQDKESLQQQNNEVLNDSNLKDKLTDILNTNKVITADIYKKLSDLKSNTTSNTTFVKNSVKSKPSTNIGYYRSSNTMLKPVKLKDYDSCSKCHLFFNKGFLIDDVFYCKDCTVKDFKNYVSKLKY